MISRLLCLADFSPPDRTVLRFDRAQGPGSPPPPCSCCRVGGRSRPSRAPSKCRNGCRFIGPNSHRTRLLITYFHIVKSRCTSLLHLRPHSICSFHPIFWVLHAPISKSYKHVLFLFNQYNYIKQITQSGKIVTFLMVNRVITSKLCGRKNSTDVVAKGLRRQWCVKTGTITMFRWIRFGG